MSEIPTTVKNKELVERRREQIVRAGIKLFSKKGFHGTTLRELAEEAGLSYGNIYDYVGSKEDIFSLIHDFAANLVMEALRSSIEHINDPIEKLRRIVRAEFNVMDEWADAILLIYQESHILSKPYLQKLLGKERQHLHIIEEAIEEALRAKRLRRCNVRLTSNLIKSMVDAWVIKRWDLRGYANRFEGEKAILDMLFSGLVRTGRSSDTPGEEPTVISGLNNVWHGQSVLVVNAGTPLGSALCTSMVSQGARVAVFSDPVDATRENPMICNQTTDRVKFFSSAELGSFSFELYQRIESEAGPVDLYVHEMGAGNLEEEGPGRGGVGRRLADNLATAEEVAAGLAGDASRRLPHRIIYVAPWGWDQLADPVRFETVRAATAALTKSVARALAGRGVNVNCLIPGYLQTTRPSMVEQRHREQVAAQIPFGRLGQISDVIEPLSFLASDGARYITGQLIDVGGGLGITVR